MRQWIAALTAAAAALPSSPAAAQSLDGAYRGMFVCQKMAASPDILHVPLDIAIKDGNVQFARPIFNWNGRRVVGSELGSGKVEADGKIRLTSQWHIRGITYRGDYSGTLTDSGGTLIGTQSWSGAGGNGASRACSAALVSAPTAQRAARRE